MSGDAADEEASGVFVQGDRSAEKARQQGRQGTDGDESAIIFDQEFPAEIGVAALHAGARLADLEISFDIVVVQAPALAFGFGADFAERFEHFEQADVVAAVALHEWERIVGGDGVDGEMLVGRGAGQKNCARQNRADRDHYPRRDDSCAPRRLDASATWRASPAHRRSVR